MPPVRLSSARSEVTGTEGHSTERDWGEYQVISSHDYGISDSPTPGWGEWLYCHLSGGLNNQIAHHLFPSTHYSHYPRITRAIREVCAKEGISFQYSASLPGESMRREELAPEIAQLRRPCTILTLAGLLCGRCLDKALPAPKGDGIGGHQGCQVTKCHQEAKGRLSMRVSPRSRCLFRSLNFQYWPAQWTVRERQLTGQSSQRKERLEGGGQRAPMRCARESARVSRGLLIAI